MIRFEPIGDDLFTVVYTGELSQINPKTQTAQLEKIFKKEPFNFEAAAELARRYAAEGRYDDACEVRFRAASEAIEAMPEDEEYFELDWEDEENQELIEAIVASGTDFYMHGDFEMSAALYETALSLDSQDHSEVMARLAISYIAIEDWDGYEQLSDSIDFNTMEGTLIDNFAAFLQGKRAKNKLKAELAEEIRAEKHDLTDEFYAEADRERVSPAVAARQLWYKHLPVFEVFPKFREQL